MARNVIGGITAACLAMLSGCGPSYSPNTYASSAVQQANKVEQGEVVGVRRVAVSADATLGTVTGAAAGGIAGSQVDGGGPVTALSALGGSVLGGVVGSGVEHATGDTTAYEYIVRQTNGDLVSVTQRDIVPLAIGQKVLVIAGKQARVVADYTVTLPGFPPPKAKDNAAAPAASAAGTPAPMASAPASPVVPGSATPPTSQAATPPVLPEVNPLTAAIEASQTPGAPPPPAPATVSAPGAAAGAPVSLALPAAAAKPPGDAASSGAPPP